MKCGATVQTAPSSQWPRDLSAFAFLHQHDRTTSRQRSSRCNGGDVSTRALERRGNALPHIGKKRSYDGCATIMAQCCSAARMARVWCFHIWRLQLWSYSLLTFIIGSFFSLGAQSCSFLCVCRTLWADIAAAWSFSTFTYPPSTRVTSSALNAATVFFLRYRHLVSNWTSVLRYYTPSFLKQN